MCKICWDIGVIILVLVFSQMVILMFVLEVSLRWSGGIVICPGPPNKHRICGHDVLVISSL